VNEKLESFIFTGKELLAADALVGSPFQRIEDNTYQKKKNGSGNAVMADSRFSRVNAFNKKILFLKKTHYKSSGLRKPFRKRPDTDTTMSSPSHQAKERRQNPVHSSPQSILNQLFLVLPALVWLLSV